MPEKATVPVLSVTVPALLPVTDQVVARSRPVSVEVVPLPTKAPTFDQPPLIGLAVPALAPASVKFAAPATAERSSVFAAPVPPSRLPPSVPPPLKLKLSAAVPPASEKAPWKVVLPRPSLTVPLAVAGDREGRAGVAAGEGRAGAVSDQRRDVAVAAGHVAGRSRRCRAQDEISARLAREVERVRRAGAAVDAAGERADTAQGEGIGAGAAGERGDPGEGGRAHAVVDRAAVVAGDGVARGRVGAGERGGRAVACERGDVGVAAGDAARAAAVGGGEAEVAGRPGRKVERVDAAAAVDAARQAARVGHLELVGAGSADQRGDAGEIRRADTVVHGAGAATGDGVGRTGVGAGERRVAAVADERRDVEVSARDAAGAAGGGARQREVGRCARREVEGVDAAATAAVERAAQRAGRLELEGVRRLCRP